MKRLTGLMAVLGLISAFACTKEESSKDNSIKFDVNVTRATDTGFENGDAISLFASDPVNATNVKLTYSDLAVVPERTLYWGDGQTTATTFNAVYPYNASYTSAEVLFGVKADQSTAAGYKASDLMAASTSQTPGNTVALNFSHKLAKLVINITNNTGYTVTGVTAGELKSRYDCATGQASESTTIKAFCPGGNAWSMIVAPQSTSGVIKVSTTGGDFTFSGDFILPAGKESTCDITVSQQTPPVGEEAAFTCTVNDWGEGESLTFVQGGTTPTPPAGNTIFSHDFKEEGMGGFTINDVSMSSNMTYVWTLTTEYGMKASAFVQQKSQESESWLISPTIDLTGETSAHMEFQHAGKFFVNVEDEFELMVTQDGGTNWNEVRIPTYPDGGSWTFVSSGDIDLSAFAGSTLQFAFRYTSTSSAAGTWEISSVEITRTGTSL